MLRRIGFVGLALVCLVLAAQVVDGTGGLTAGATGLKTGPRSAANHLPGDLRRFIDSHYCDGCQPPLLYHGGPVMDTHGSQGLTVTPIFWQPPARARSFPSGYESLISGYIGNVAAAGAVDTNVYSIDTEYYSIVNGQLSHIEPHITAGTPVVVTDPLPADGCSVDTSDVTDHLISCITDDQIQSELNRVLTRLKLPRGLANFYPMFFAPGVETADADGTTSASDYCGYHSNTGTTSDQIIYGNEPYDVVGCGGGQSPNHNLAADTAIGTLSHELNEATTDPEVGTGNIGWNDASGSEIGDICAADYGKPLGSTDPKAPQSSEYNQVINGGRYYTQTEFSNYAYRHFGVGFGCQPSEALAHGPVKPGATEVANVFSDPYPNTLPANGRATSSVYVTVGDKDRNAISGDRVSFSSYAIYGSGDCGTLNHLSGKTGSDGSVTVTYTASRANVACVVVADDALGGKSASAIIYQGRTQSLAPTAGDTFPSSVTAGRVATFSARFTNPRSFSIPDSQIVFAVFPYGPNSPNVRADQITVSFSSTGPGGPWHPLTLGGSTGEGEIRGVMGGATGFTFPAHRTVRVYFRMTVATSVRRHLRSPLISLENYLYQIDPASGAGDVVADTLATDVSVK